MKKLLGPAVLLLLCSLPTFAQYEESRLEVGGGYTYRSLDIPGSPRVNMNGWDGNAAFNVTRWFAMAVDGDGAYHPTTDPNGGTDHTTVLTVMAGPRFYPVGHHKLTPFVQGLFGKGFLDLSFPTNSSGPAFSLSDDFFAWSAGGGVDYTVSKHIAVRLGEFDYEQFQSILLDGYNVPSPHQNNFKYKGGIVFRF